ncbi:MAG: beta-galactosidase [Kiritimatiellae bacterium]|nr:beta-galactosidase [Kiritimatiellia bacterium]
MNARWLFLSVTGLAAVASAAVNNPYGACAHVTRGEPTGRTCAMMRQAGMGWVRSDFDWRAIEKKKGVWDFTYFDKVLAESEAEGVQLLPILGYSVPWAHPAHAHLDAWEEYVRKVVTHYGKRLPVLEVWNEENIPGFWKDPNPTNYLAVLRRTYETAKKIDPNVRIAFGGTAGVPFKFIEGVYKLGGAKWFDIMNIHPYSHPRRPEGAMDAQIEKLRILMAQYGDAQKPIWITEVGWPTHSLRFSEGGLLLAGLKVARPELKAWRMLYVPARTDETGGEADEAVRTQLLNVLPKGSRVEVCRSLDLAKRLAKGDVDGVVYPFTENYAADSVDAVYAFVKAGGVLVDFGGMPMWTAYRADADGVMQPDKKAEPWKDRQRLRIAETAWWTDKRYPESIPVRPTAAAKGVKIPPKGFTGERFLTPRLLQKGDAFIPLLSAPTNGIEAAAAAVYKFNSDMKGAIVVSGLFGRGSHGTSSNDRQAKMVARALGIAFAEGIENFFWYEFRQPDHDPYDPESYFGMVHDNFAPKPAYGAYMTFVDARPVGSVQKAATWRSADGTVYFPQWTRPDKRKAGMIWTTKAAHERNLTFTSPNVTFLDVAGARVRPERAGNVVTLTLSDSPIYFFGGELKDLP